MKIKNITLKRCIAWLMLVSMSINSLGNQAMVVHATEFDSESHEESIEETEDEMKVSEKTADVSESDDNDSVDDENIDKKSDEVDSEGIEKLEDIEGDSAYDSKISGVEDSQTYEDMTISNSTTLSEDIEVDNLIIKSALKVNGHKVIVHGDLTLNNYLYVEEGYIVVKGNMNQNGYGCIYTTGANDHILVDGNYSFVNNGQTISNGILEIQGDIIGDKSNTKDNKIKFDKNSKVILSGSNMQTVDMATDSGLDINNLIITNSSDEGVVSHHMINALNIDDKDNKLHYPSNGVNGETLTEDTVINGDFTLLKGTLDLAGYNLTIKGDLVHAGGLIVVNGGSLTVKGNYERQFSYIEDDTEIVENSSGVLVMDKETDHVIIEGDYIDSGLRDEATYLTAGTLEFKGNIKGGLFHFPLQTTGDCTVKFTGSKKQVLDRGEPCNYNLFSFANMVIEQSEDGSISWEESILVTKYVDHLSGNVTGKTEITDKTSLGNNLYGTVCIGCSYTFENDTTFHGDLYLGDGYFSKTYLMPDTNINVKGNCYVLYSYFNKNTDTGILTVSGDLILQKGNCSFDAGILEVKGDIKSDGDDYISISCGEKSTLRMTGSKEQHIDAPANYTILNNVEIDNPNGVVVGENVTVVNVTSIQGVMTYASGGVHGYTLEEDGEYDGNLEIAGGVLDLNGHTLHVKGDFTVSGGALTMINSNDHLIVDGDFLTKSQIDHKGKLTDGVLEVKGNFTQEVGSKAYAASDNHTTIFSGNAEQQVKISDYYYSYFNNVMFSKNSKVTLVNVPRAYGLITQDGSVSGDIGIGSTSIFNNNTYNGDVTLINSVSLKDDLTINGNLSLSSRYNLILDHHTLNVNGNVSMDNANISMLYDDDILVISGDLIISRLYNYNAFENGIVKIAGDVSFSSSTSVKFGTGSITELNGTKKQTITMDGNSHKFGKLLINNTSEDGIYVTDSLNCEILDNSSGSRVVFANGGTLGHTLEKDEIIDGDMMLSGGVLDLNGHSITIKGDFTYAGGTVILNGGTLFVEKEFNNSIILNLGEGKLDIDGDWIVGRNVSADNTDISIAGDITKGSNVYTLDLIKSSCIHFDGNKKQIIDKNINNIYFNNVDIVTKNGIDISDKRNYCIYGKITANNNPIEGVVYLYGSIVDASINANVCFMTGSILNNDLVVNGDAEIGELDLNGHKLTVTGTCYILKSSYVTSNKSKGTIDIKGDFIHGRNSATYTLENDLDIILSGDQKQTIDFGNCSISMHKLVVNNTSDEGVLAESYFDVDIIEDMNKKLSFKDEGTVGYKLTKDTVIQDDMTLVAGEMNLNGYKLTILGNLNQIGGKINVNGGELNVTGDYIIAKKDENGSYKDSNGTLYMSDVKSKVVIEGDFIVSTSKNIAKNITAGTFDIKGDLLLYINGSDYQRIPADVLFVFSGTSKQIISNEGNWGSRVSLGTIKIDNTSTEGVVLIQNYESYNPIKNCSRLHGTSGKSLFWYNSESPEFKSFEGDLYINNEMVLKNDLSVSGTIYVKYAFDLNGHQLITDNLVVNRSLTINGGVLQVNNNFSMDDNYYSSSSHIIMNNDNDVIQVTGNLKITTGRITWTKGHTDIKGNIDISTTNCEIGENHTMTLSGKINSSGKAYTQSIAVPADFRFNKLVLTKPRDYYIFSRDVEDMCAELVDDIKDLTPPSTPTGLSAAEVNYTSVKLTWDASTDDTGVSGYDVYRDEKKIMSVTGTSYTDKKLTPGTEYSYFIVAKDVTYNTSAYSKALSVSTIEDTVAPSVPTGIVLSERCGTTLTIQYDASSDNAETTGYHIYRNGELVGNTRTTSYTDGGLTANESYRYQISAYDVSGNESALSDEFEAYTQTVAVSDISPKNYSKISGKEADISVSFANTGSINGYNVYMAYKEDGSDELHELINKKYGKNTSYRSVITASAKVDTTLIHGESIDIIVKIADAGGYECENTYTYYMDRTPPSKLSETGVEVRNGVAVISFEKGKEADIAGYRIYRQEAAGEKELVIDSPTPDKTYYYDKTVVSGKEYTYYVSAYDEEGLEGELSDGMKVSVGADEECPRIESIDPLDGILTGIEKITITASDNKALDKLKIMLSGNGSQEDTILDEIDISNGKAEYELDTSKLAKDVTLIFTVYDISGNTNADEFACTYTIDNEGPAAPSGVTAEIYSTTAVLSWDNPIDDDYAYALVERIEGNGSRTEIARPTSTTGCVIEGLTPLETTNYQVTFYDIQGNAGTPSDLISVTAGEDTIVPRINVITPQGGYFNYSIPLSVKAYDNCNVESVYIDYSFDKTTWENAYTCTFDTPEKQPTVKYDLDTSKYQEGKVYVRAYAVDTSGNLGDKEQVMIEYIIDHSSPTKVDKLTVSGEEGSIYLKWNEPVDNDVAGYRLYRSIEGLDSYQCINSSINTISYYDRSAAYDTSYCYYLTAYDHAGNESDKSNIVTAQKQDDEKKPVVHSIVPEKNVMLAKTVEISAMVSDNDVLSSVRFAIKSRDENSVPIELGNVDFDKSSGTVTYAFDTTAFSNGEYDICVTATDRSGNVSSELTSSCIIHNVSLETPDLFAVAGDWCVNVHCTLDESLTYVLYRKCQQTEDNYSSIISGAGTLVYRDNDINPKYTYIYQIVIKDAAGNTNRSALRYVKPNAVDTTAPVASINTNTSVVEEYETIFSGMDSTDNDRIVKYTWDFGDGSDEVTGPTPKHAYKKSGSYIVKLTVEDASGNTGYDTAKITVLPKQSSGKAIVTVNNAKGSPMRDVMIYVNSSTSGNDMVRTDNKGQAVIMQKPGTYKIALYKSGYVATEESVEIELHGENVYTFTLNEGETVSADFKVRQMDFDEIVAAGIDLSDPTNQHVFTVETTLKFADATRTPEVITEPMIPAMASVSIDRGHAGDTEGIGGGGGTYISPETGEPVEGEPVPDLYYTIHITQSISWLKDMYEATLIVYNNANSQTIVAKDLTATLQLPTGLSLAATKQGQNMTNELPDIKGGETCNTTWYVRGDARGKYSLNAMLKGTLQPFGADFTCNFTSNEFDVTAGEGLVLTIQPEDRAEKGEQYYVYFTLSNEGSKEFYNVNTTFGTHHANSKRFVTNSDGSKPLPVMSQDDVVMVECLKPGESISGIYKRILPVDGDKWLNYKRLVDAEYEVLDDKNLGVSVVLSVVASHVAVPALVYQMPTQENSEADPVNVSTGAYTDNITALSVQGVNPVSADISYDSNATSDLGEFGYGWSHNYESRLRDMKDGTIQYYVSPTGYYTFLASHFDADNMYKENAAGYYELDLSKIPMEETFKCLNENKAGYELKRDKDGKFTLTDKAGNITHFDKKGNLTSIKNKEGKEVLVERQSDSFTVIDKASERHLTYNLDKDTKLVTSVTDGTRKAEFYYDEDNCLKQFVNAKGESTYYTYDNLHRITSVTNDDNVTYVTNTYEVSDDEKTGVVDPDKSPSSSLGEAYKKGRVKSQKDALGNTTKFVYEENEKDGSLKTTVTTRNGKKKVTVTDLYGNVTSQTNEAGNTTTTTYDENGNETYVNPPDMTTVDGKTTSYSMSYKYDSDGNMTSMSNSMLEKDEDEAVMTYDKDGNMLTMKNRNGESMECTYYDNGQIHTVKDQNGNVITYEYNENGQILKETDGNDKSIEYNYEHGDLVSVKDRNGNVTKYTYNAEGLVEKTTVEDKVSKEEYTTTNFYDELGRISMVHDVDGGTTFYDYDCNGNITEKTEPSGSRTVYEYDGNNQMTKESVYPSDSSEEPDSVTTYTYTKEGLLKTVTDCKSETVITNSYDEVGNKTKEIETKGEKKLSEKHYAYDELGNKTTESVHVIDKEGNDTGSLTTQYIYYPNSKLNKVIDYTGAETTYSYDKSWRTQFIESTTEPLTEYRYDRAGRVEKEIIGKNSDGENSTKESTVTSYGYDIYGHVTKATDAMGNSTQYRYDANGNLTDTVDATGRVAYSKYDSLNRVIETGVRKPGTTEDIALAKTSYNIKEHTVTTTDMINGGSVTTYYDTAGREYKTVNGEGVLLLETIYDTENRILQSVDAKGMVSENVYNSLGQIEKVNEGAKGDKKEDGTYIISGDIHTESYEYDDLGRTDKVTDADNGVSSVVFDSLGRIVSLKDPNQNEKDAEGKAWSLNNGNTYTYEYNDKGLLSKETNSLNNVTTYEYNAKMLLDKMTDSAGEDTEYKYDALNRLEEVKDELGTIKYEYDANGNVLEVKEDPKGLLNMSKTIVRTYDNLNRVTSYTDYKGREVKYGYDELGNLRTLTYPGGEIVTYDYNPDGKVNTMSSKSGGTFYYTYDSYGRLKQIKRPDGSVEERKYDDAGQLKEQVDKDKDGNILQKNNYTYDVFGEITEKSTSTDGDLNKLVSVNMEYDSANRLTKYNGEEVTYDVKGNMIKGPVDGEMTELTYDCRNRLVKAGKVSYTYDCENTRISSTEDEITTEYVTDTGGILSRMLIAYESVGTSDASETHYYYGAEGLACQNNDTTGQYFAYHYDNIGSTTLITDKTGRIIEKFAYGTYGELLTEVVNNIRFLYNGSYGVVTDSNGLYYMRARYYNPDIKRFINQDIKVGDISNGQGLNRYAYCEGNPISMVDPFGLCGENANEQGEASKYQWLHNALDMAGLFFDVADVVNAGVYALEGKWGQAAVSMACALPAIGTAIAGVSKATKFAKAGNIIGQAMKYAGKGFMTVQTASESLKLAGDARAEYAVNGGKLTWSVAKKAVGALALGALATMSASSLMKDVTSLTKMSDVKTKTTVADVADSVSGKVEKSSGISGENISAGSGGMMKNRNRGSVVWPFGKGGSGSDIDRIKKVTQQSYDYAVNNPRQSGLNRMQLGKDAEVQATRWTRKWAERNGIDLSDEGLHFQVRGNHSIPDVVYEPTHSIMDFKLTPKAIRKVQSDNFKLDFPDYSIEYIFGPGPWRDN